MGDVHSIVRCTSVLGTVIEAFCAISSTCSFLTGGSYRGRSVVRARLKVIVHE